MVACRKDLQWRCVINVSNSSEQKFIISARYLGPVFTLDAELSGKRQNLIFARNGTGKSFLSRGLRYLDKADDPEALAGAAYNLVSDESPDGSGSFSISKGDSTLGSLSLQKTVDIPTAETPGRIFHVFSEDFVQEELRENHYKPDGNIEHQIAVDVENIKLNEAKEAVDKTEAAVNIALEGLRKSFDSLKVIEVNGKAGVSKNLNDYKTLSLHESLTEWTTKPDAPTRSFAEILKDLDSLKSIPAEPNYPAPVVSIHVNDIDFGAIADSLQKITSPSSVSESIKSKIEEHRDFFETGASIVADHSVDACPFCNQSILEPPAATTIETYIAYFRDEEAKHKTELRGYLKKLTAKEAEIEQLSPRISHQRTRFDALKRYVPSQQSAELADGELEIKEACAVISRLKGAIETKTNALEQATKLPSDSLAEKLEELAKTIENNNSKVAILQSSIEKSDEERKALQRNSCAVFAVEFTRDHWSEISEIRKLQSVLQENRNELTAQEKASPKKDAKERVADTFELLLRQFFADKYAFDRENFVLKRDNNEMARGPHRTLSDGEKTAMAFCYFVACIHRKVESAEDYQRLFLVFDDPVTSMSYDFIFTIAQTLKNLGISKNGDISTDPSLISSGNYLRPELIILTHSSYFFNISLTNRVVNESAAFALHLDNQTHKLTRLNNYVAPFQQQLADIYDVAVIGKEPDHRTGNAIRSVLEAIGRFCRPDKSDSLTNFITYLAGQGQFEIKSIMINSLSHGTYYEETPPPDDLKLACQETIKIVEKFAEGQLELIRAAKGQ